MKGDQPFDAAAVGSATQPAAVDLTCVPSQPEVPAAMGPTQASHSLVYEPHCKAGFSSHRPCDLHRSAVLLQTVSATAARLLNEINKKACDPDVVPKLHKLR